MSKHRISFRLTLAALLVAPALAGAAAQREAPPPAAPAPDPSSIHTVGGAPAGGGGIRIELRDVPTGDPERVEGELRGHEQGDARDVAQPDAVFDADSDRPVTDGPAPASAQPRNPDAPSAVGDLRRNFVGQGASGWLPPDPVLAVGPRHVVEVVNSGFTIFSKDGGLERAYTDLEGFFGPSLFPILPIPCTNANCFVFDPRIIFSHGHGKFLMMALVRDDVEPPQLHLLRHLGHQQPARRRGVSSSLSTASTTTPGSTTRASAPTSTASISPATSSSGRAASSTRSSSASGRTSSTAPGTAPGFSGISAGRRPATRWSSRSSRLRRRTASPPKPGSSTPRTSAATWPASGR